MDDAQALYWYGSYSLIMTGASLAVLVLFNQEISHIANYTDGFQTVWYYYVGVGVTWFLTGFIQDNETLEGILRRLIVLSVLGPFWHQWQSFISWMWTWNDNQGLFWYIWTAGWFSAIII